MIEYIARSWAGFHFMATTRPRVVKTIDRGSARSKRAAEMSTVFAADRYRNIWSAALSDTPILAAQLLLE